ncbi:MAG: TM0106 family RecB-like putative nuclease [Gemmatimonadaceae bacterium]
MRQDGQSLVLSATDLSNFLGCRHRTALEMDAAAGLRKRPYFEDPLLKLLFQRGIDHERKYVDSLRAEGHRVEDLSHIVDRHELLAATEAALRAGRDIVVQGALGNKEWFGKPDILRRVATPSRLGDWSYEVQDTKLARDTRAGAILQLGLYSEMLTTLQGLAPERFHVVTPDATHAFRLSDFAAYLRLTRNRLAATVAQPAAAVAAVNYPEPVEHCDICPWAGECREKRRADDHLSLVAGITRTQRRVLDAHGTHTLTALGRLPLPIPFKPDRGSVGGLIRVRDQARLQIDSRGRTPPLHELREIVKGEGLCRLPEASPGDIFLDLEGDNLAVEGGREYLFGVVTRGAKGEPEYTSYWAADDREERAAFEAVIDCIVAAAARHPHMHVFHYAAYEATAFKRLMGRYATRSQELDGMLRAGRFVDLYAVVRQGLRAGIERYSIKNLEPLYGFDRAVPLDKANKALHAYQYALATNATRHVPAPVRDIVEGYNRDDCVSTLRLCEWLERVRAGAVDRGATIPRPVLNGEPKPELEQRQLETEARRQRLLAGIGEIPPRDTPEYARWLLAYLLDFHRRENKAGWWKYYELCGATDEELLDEPEAVAGLELRQRVEIVLNKKTKKPTGSVVDRYAYPPQEMEIGRGDELKTRDGSKFGDVAAVERGTRTIDVWKGRKNADSHPVAVFAHSHVRTEVLEDAIAAVADAVAAQRALDGANGVARALLLRERPRLTSGTFVQPEGANGSELAVQVVQRLDHTLLAVQGPPGSGKTYTGARMISALVAGGKRIGVTGPSHKAIINLLAEVCRSERSEGSAVRPIRIAHLAKKDEVDVPAPITRLTDNDDARRALAGGEMDVVGGTAWLWARPDMAGSVDVILVDEAGQVSLANAVAMSAAAEGMVLLGDPQQLDQPQQGTHPDGVGDSALHHVIGDGGTIASDRGIFLAETWRLSPAICDFTSELFYESRLDSKLDLERQVLTGIGELSGSGLWYVDVEHEGCTSASDEEAAVVAGLMAKLVAPGSCWVSSKGETSQLALDDVLVVSPFNAQVSRLVDRLPAGARVGTVDKFQGQAAPVVIYSMATSRPEDAPRGMEFLFSLNRLNVATSRAQCAVIVVANKRLFEVECRSPRQMVLANALCRYRELARSTDQSTVPLVDLTAGAPNA